MVSTVNPAPSATITPRAPAPGRCRLASAMRMRALPRFPTSRAARTTSQAMPTSRAAATTATATKIAPRRRSATPATASAANAARLSPSPISAATGGRRRGGTSSARNMPAGET